MMALERRPLAPACILGGSRMPCLRVAYLLEVDYIDFTSGTLFVPPVSSISVVHHAAV
jgi:hypothetical protein